MEGDRGMNQQMIICRGLPASGKSTWAKTVCRVGEGWTRVNRDDLREMMHGGAWSRKNEKIVVAARNSIILGCLESGVSVIVDDTNGATVNALRTLAASYPETVVSVKNFPISIKEAIRRDALRPKPVGESVIRGMQHLFLDIILEDEA